MGLAEELLLFIEGVGLKGLVPLLLKPNAGGKFDWAGGELIICWYCWRRVIGCVGDELSSGLVK